MEPTFSQFFQSNNKLAYTGEDKQKHPTLRITDKNDECICNFKLPLGTTFIAGRTWEGNTTENFITLTDKDTRVSCKVVSICNVDNKNVTVVAEKDTLPTGWPAWYHGNETLTIVKGIMDTDRSFTINRGDNRPITHKCTKEIHFKFSVIWPTPPLEKRAETFVNNEPPETLEVNEPQETLVVEETLEYRPPPPKASAPKQAPPPPQDNVMKGPFGGASKLSPAPKKPVPEKKSNETPPDDTLKAQLLQKVGDANKASITEIKVWVQDERFKDVYKCTKVDKNGKPINGFLLNKFLEEQYAIWKCKNRELDTLYSEICKIHNDEPLVILAQIKKDEAAEATRQRKAENAKIRKKVENELRQEEKVRQRIEAKKSKKQKAEEDDRSEPEEGEKPKKKSRKRTARAISESDSD
jgi:hypothetical protein